MKHVYKPVTPIDGEQWRPIDGYPNYRVSNLGRIESTANGREPYLLEWKQYGKRKVVFLSSGKKRWLVERAKLIMYAFVGEKPKGYFTIHKNLDFDDDCLDNLTYANPKEYGEYIHNIRVETGYTKGHEREQAILKRRADKRQYQLKYSLMVTSGKMTLKEAGRELGISESGMCRVVKRLT